MTLTPYIVDAYFKVIVATTNLYSEPPYSDYYKVLHESNHASFEEALETITNVIKDLTAEKGHIIDGYIKFFTKDCYGVVSDLGALVRYNRQGIDTSYRFK